MLVGRDARGFNGAPAPSRRLRAARSPPPVHASRASGARSARRKTRAASGAALPACTAPANVIQLCRPGGNGPASATPLSARISTTPQRRFRRRRRATAAVPPPIANQIRRLRLDQIGDAEPADHARDLRAREAAAGRIGMHDRARRGEQPAHRVLARDVGQGRARAHRDTDADARELGAAAAREGRGPLERVHDRSRQDDDVRRRRGRQLGADLGDRRDGDGGTMAGTSANVAATTRATCAGAPEL